MQSENSFATSLKTPLQSPSLLQPSSSNSSSPKKLFTPIKSLFNRRSKNSDDDHSDIHEIPSRQKNKLSKVNGSSRRKDPIKKSIRSIKTKASSKTKRSSDSSSIDSDDSNFSFVKDMKGGRNTSIKYYKTKPVKKNYFDSNMNEDHDLDVEDYDYENNGIDDYDNMEDDINYIDDFGSDQERDEEDYFNYGNRYRQDEFVNPVVDDNYDYDEQYAEVDDMYSDEYTHDEVFAERHLFSDDDQIKNQQLVYLNKESVLSYVPHDRIPYNKSYHLSINGLRNLSQSELDDELDYFNSYFDTDESNSTATPKNMGAFENFELFDLNSPLVNGLTIGNNENNRIKNLHSNANVALYKGKIKSFHLSIDEINLIGDRDVCDENDIGLGIDYNNELKFGDVLGDDTSTGDFTFNTNTSLNEEEIETKRDEILDQIDESTNCIPEIDKKSEKDETSDDSSVSSNTISQDLNPKTQTIEETEKQNLEVEKTFEHMNLKNTEDLPDGNTAKGKKNRKSVNEMMNLLEDLQLNNDSPKSKRDSIENMMGFLKNVQKTLPKKSDNKVNHNKRLSNGNESVKLKSETISDNEADLNEMERDLIDEINQLPEDFDFDTDQEIMNNFNKLQESIKSNSFMRSNSYNKKPKKFIPDLLSPSTNNNKIITSDKTVTYYNKLPVPQEMHESRKSPNNVNDLSTINEDKT